MPTPEDSSRPAPDPPAGVPAGEFPGAWDQTRALARDRVVQLYLVGAVLVAAAFPPGFLAEPSPIGPSVVALHFSFLAPVALLCGFRLRALASPEERQAWTDITAALWFGIVPLALHVVVPERRWDPRWSLAVDGTAFVYYVFLLLGIERLADRRPAPFATSSWIRPAGIAALVVGWTTYAGLLPDAFSPTRSSHASLVGYLALDAIVVIRLQLAWHACADARSGALAGWLTIAFALLGLSDAAGWFVAPGVLAADAGMAYTLLWCVPPFALLLAVRSRELLPQPDAPRDERRPDAAGVPSGMTILLLGAFSFPVVHIAWEAAGRLPSPLADAQETVAAAGMCVLGALAALRYQQVETDRSSLQDRYRSLEAAVLQAQKMEAVGRLAGGIAHDFNNLLTAIGGYADMLLDSLPASDPTAAAMTHVRGAVEQATRLTRQLLALSRRQVLKSEPVDVNDAIRHLVSLHENLLGSQVTVTMDPGAAPALAMVDPAQLQQVLLNVVLNGRDAMPSGGRLTLATSNVVLDPDETIGWPDAAPGAYVRVVVRDTGTGIPSDVLPRIFEPFFTTKPSGRGTGLGLSMVYGIVRQTGGRVTVETQAETGTAVVIDLPAARVPAAAPPAAAVRRDRRGTETVLVVEDEAAVRELVQAMLALGGYRILVAAGGDEALRAAAAHDGPIDLLLSDVVMPGMNGRALAERLLAARPDMRVLFMTGYTDDALVQHGVLDGAFAMLPKPFTRQALIDAVRGALDRPPAQAAGGAGGPGGLP